MSDLFKQKLQQKLFQKLSPQQIQMIKLLEVPSLHIEERIKKELEENPALEEGEEDEDIMPETAEDEMMEDKESEEFTLEDYIDEDDIPDYRFQTKNISRNEDRKTEIPFSVGYSFHEHLSSQFGLRELTEKQKVIGEYIIGNIDEDGYLRRSLSSIVDYMAFLQNIETTEKELETTLKIIQDLEPAGVGARTLQESLRIQMEKKDKSQPAIKLAQIILKSYFKEFSKKHYDKITERLEVSEIELKMAIEEILKLNPKPGGMYSDPFNKPEQSIIPDFILELTEDGFDLHLNSRNMPELKLSSTYNDMLQTYGRDKNQKKEMKEAVMFVRQKIESARWFIDAVKQRQNTLLLTMNAIIRYQKEYFVDGDEVLLKPMKLKDIAEITKLDISTISRVVNGKFIQTHFGILPLKYFFSEGFQTESGEEVSTREVKRLLQDCINNENKKNPLNDDQLTEVLKKKGYPIARRTVAKYRVHLNIPVARLRKEI